MGKLIYKFGYYFYIYDISYNIDILKIKNYYYLYCKNKDLLKREKFTVKIILGVI